MKDLYNSSWDNFYIVDILDYLYKVNDFDY